MKTFVINGTRVAVRMEMNSNRWFSPLYQRTAESHNPSRCRGDGGPGQWHAVPGDERMERGERVTQRK